MTYRLSLAAENDLIAIYLYGAQEFGAQFAETYQEKLEHSIKLIGENPRMARERTEMTPIVRIHPVGSHLIVYALDGECAHILRLRHHSEGWIDV